MKLTPFLSYSFSFYSFFYSASIYYLLTATLVFLLYAIVFKQGGQFMGNYSINLLEMGKRIKALRLKQNKTQSYFADILYISPSYLALIESGKRTATIDVLAQISKVCNVSTDYLLFGTPIPPENVNQKTFQQLVDVYPPNEIDKSLRLAKYYLELNKETI